MRWRESDEEKAGMYGHCQRLDGRRRRRHRTRWMYGVEEALMDGNRLMKGSATLT